MKKIDHIVVGCIIIGGLSITLSFIGAFIPLNGFRGYNLPFQFLVTSFYMGQIAVAKLTGFVDLLQMPVGDYIFSIILAISGIGTIWVKPWGRKFGYIYAWSMIALLALGMLFIVPGYAIMYNELVKQGDLMFIPVYLGGGGYLIALLLALPYPITLLIFFSRARIKERFSGV